jgi:membrane associated rhomboid family serine protease
MHLAEPEPALDPVAQRRRDRARLLRAFNASLGAVLVLAAMYSAQGAFDAGAWTVAPHTLAGLRGLLLAPLLHASAAHLAANTAALLLLGTLAGCVYPRATVRALPVLWLGAGLGAWMLGAPGTHHLGASGVTHGLGFLVFTLAVLRRDRAAIAAAMLAFAFYGGMLLSVLPRAPDVSWESHLGGALAGVLAGIALRRADPMPARRRYSWELEDASDEQI